MYPNSSRLTSSEERDGRKRGQYFLLELALFSAFGIASYKVWIKYGRRIRTNDHVTWDMLKEKRWVTGKVTSVGDGDGFRLFHTPLFWIGQVPTTRKELTDQIIRIRVAGADAPEGAYFGRPAQPFAAESHEWLKRKILGKKVYCQLLQRDQYSRIVANVAIPTFPLPGRHLSLPKNLALEMLKAGYATTYEQASAVYGKEGKDVYLAAEREAKAKRRGMWKNGINIETPAEYKRRYSEATPSAEKGEPQRTAIRRQPSKNTLLKWLRRFLRK